MGSLLLELTTLETSHWQFPTFSLLTGHMFRMLLPWESFLLSMNFRFWPFKNHWIETSALFVKQVRTTESLSSVTVVLLN